MKYVLTIATVLAVAIFVHSLGAAAVNVMKGAQAQIERAERLAQ